jgi:hypothetical protein
MKLRLYHQWNFKFHPDLFFSFHSWVHLLLLATYYALDISPSNILYSDLIKFPHFVNNNVWGWNRSLVIYKEGPKGKKFILRISLMYIDCLSILNPKP